MARTASTPAEAVKTIDRHELKAKIDRTDSFVLLETLAPEHFQHVHLPGATQCATRSRKGVRLRTHPQQGHAGGDLLRRSEVSRVSRCSACAGGARVHERASLRRREAGVDGGGSASRTRCMNAR